MVWAKLSKTLAAPSNVEYGPIVTVLTKIKVLVILLSGNVGSQGRNQKGQGRNLGGCKNEE